MLMMSTSKCTHTFVHVRARIRIQTYAHKLRPQDEGQTSDIQADGSSAQNFTLTRVVYKSTGNHHRDHHARPNPEHVFG